MSPIHVIAVTPPESVQITEGTSFLQTAKGYGKMRHIFCAKCGSMIYQCPEGAQFRALMPTNFHIEDGVSCKLPQKYLPKAHINYENRQYDWFDELPKYKTFMPGGKMPSKGRCDNQGNDIST